MKKFFYFSVSAVVAIALTAVVTFKVLSSKPTAKNLLLDENIEALSSGETETKLDCYNTITSKKGCQVRYCSTCTFIPGTAAFLASPSTCMGYE